MGPQPASPLYKLDLPDVPETNSITAFVNQLESKHKIKPGNKAEIIWADTNNKTKTEYTVVYLHGFSASKEEGNPVHLNLAKSLNANLYLARLADHGIDTVQPMQYMTADRLWESAKMAFAIGQKLGQKVILVGTSTGGTLALKLAAQYPQVQSLILLSPNIAINDDKAWMLNNPWGLQIARKVSGGLERQVEGKSELYKKFWYTNYRLESLVELEELVESSMNSHLFAQVKQPVLLLYYYKNEKEQDKVVKVDAMLKMYEQLGTPPNFKQKIALPNTGNHVIGSYITSHDIPAVTSAILQYKPMLLGQK
ncbi:MAG: alpha/beta hydrolase [Pedobacter sp.]|nr:MAG: alpha/beta hydrolase [Pedobacter sp.]